MQCKWCCSLLTHYLITKMNQSQLLDDHINNNNNNNNHHNINDKYNQPNPSQLEMEITKKQHDHIITAIHTNPSDHNNNHNDHHSNGKNIKHKTNDNLNYEQPFLMNECSSDILNPPSDIDDDDSTNNNGNNNDKVF